MADFYSLTTVANSAALLLVGIDSGGSLTTQQLSDTLPLANDLLDSWTREQVAAMQTALESFTLAGGTYTPGSVLQFPDTTTPISFPAGWGAVMRYGLAIAMASTLAKQPPPGVLEMYKEARSQASPFIVRLTGNAPEAAGAAG